MPLIEKAQVTTLLGELRQQNIQRIIEIVDAFQLTPEKLEALCKAPALTHENVQLYLNACSKETLANLFYTTGLVKLAEIVEQKQQKILEEQENQNATTSNQPETSAPTSVPDDGKPTGRN